MKIFNNISVLVVLVVSLVFITSPIAIFAADPAAVNLGTAGNFTVLAKTGISTTGATSIIGDIGISPAAASYITGFALYLPSASVYSLSSLVTGEVYAPGYADPTPANLTTAVLDMQNAYTDGAGRAADVTELGAGNIGGLTLAPGVYKWSTGLTIPTDVTLSGGANDVWIFQVAQNLNISSAAKVILSGGAQANNIFWVVAGQTTIGTTAIFNGNILDQTTIVLNTGAQLNGRALAQAAVTFDANTVSIPTTPAPTPTPTPTSTPAPTQSQMYSPISLPLPDASERAALQVQLNELLVISQALQAQVQARQQGSSASASDLGQKIRSITGNLGTGSRDNDVSILQQFLISQNKGLSSEALAKVGATAYFGELTRAALAEFQAKVGISPALGNFGPITRAYMSAHY